ncbi:hypothetical protein ABZ864_40805 [Streptomyces sp. NPDC047082]|uniref:hypothetical protein n=1 Tax=Streptomyces sp. NPDC047082 TaxID=3155259 RepID=UPI0033F2FB67
MTEFNLDLDGANRTRTALLAGLRDRGSVDGDIVAALSQPGVPDALLSQPFQVVADLDELVGSGPFVDVPEQWREGLEPRIGADDRDQLVLFYQRVLTSGTREDQRSLIDGARLGDNWPAVAREVHPAIALVWEQRFPGLRR